MKSHLSKFFLACLFLFANVAFVNAFIPSTRTSSSARSESIIQRFYKTFETDDTNLTSTTTSIELSSLPLPPNNGLNLYRNLRDTFSYISSPKRFINERYKKLGPTFLAYQFFKPTVFVGNMTLVTEYTKTAERDNQVIYPVLPDTFAKLHSGSSLNMASDDAEFKEVRMLLADVLASKEALKEYTKVLEEFIEEYVTSIETRVREDPDRPIYLVPELISLSLNMFATIFTGKGLTKEQEQMFLDYNAGFLSLSTKSKQMDKAKEALKQLQDELLRQFHEMDHLNEEEHTILRKYYQGRIAGCDMLDVEDMNDRIVFASLLLIWAGYVECASLMATSLSRISATKDPSLSSVQSLCSEMNERLNVDGADVKDFKFWELPYSLGVCRESLRLEPPGAGLPKYSKNDYKLGEFRIPAEVPVCLDPRIVNQDPSVHVDPNNFEPLRWVPCEKDMTSLQSSSACPFQGVALKRPEAWFPGGKGSHRCPGLPLAEHVSKMFLSKMSTRFASWEYNGDGLGEEGDIKFIEIPIRIPPNDFGLKFKLRES